MNYQNLFEALRNVCGFTALQNEMETIIAAVEKDKILNELHEVMWDDFDIMRWSEKEQDDILTSSKVHAFKQVECKEKYTGTKYIGNKTLCGKFALYEDYGVVEKWSEVAKCSKTEPFGSVCKTCLKIAQKVTVGAWRTRRENCLSFVKV